MHFVAQINKIHLCIMCLRLYKSVNNAKIDAAAVLTASVTEPLEAADGSLQPDCTGWLQNNGELKLF